MDIKASDIKDLREKTGAGMMDCKKALVEAGGDPAKAEKLLKEWGLAGVEKRAGRATNEGRIFMAEKDGAIALVEIACETDFVARNEDFIKAGNGMAAQALAKGWDKPVAELSEQVQNLAIVIKENITLKRVVRVEAKAGQYVHSYMHGEGKIGVIVTATSDKPEVFKNDELATFIHDVALHIAAFRPMFLEQSRIDAGWIKEQEEIFQKQVEGDEKMKGKPANVVQGILKGKLNKLMSDICLLDQGFVRDEKQKVSAVMAGLGKTLGAKLSLVDYVYVRVGEA